MKLHLGCGDVIREGYINIDARALPGVDMVLDLSEKLPFGDNSVDEIYSHHLIEHLTQTQGMNLVMECYRVLKAGGTVMFCCPDMSMSCQVIVEADLKEDIETVHRQIRGIYGYDSEAYMHRWAYTPKMIENLFKGIGFKVTSCIRQPQCGGDGIELRAAK